MGQVSTWRSVETDGLPDSSRSVLILTPLGHNIPKLVPAIACYIRAKTVAAAPEEDWGEYDAETNVYWCPEGWYLDVVLTDFVDYSYEYYPYRVCYWREIPPLPRLRSDRTE